MSKLEKLLLVGNVGVYRVIGGGYGVSLDFYDQSYYLSQPADTIDEAINEMFDEWRVQSALSRPNHLLEQAYSNYITRLERETYDE